MQCIKKKASPTHVCILYVLIIATCFTTRECRIKRKLSLGQRKMKQERKSRDISLEILFKYVAARYCYCICYFISQYSNWIVEKKIENICSRMYLSFCGMLFRHHANFCHEDSDRKLPVL